MKNSANLMVVTNTIEQSPVGGREMLCKMNHDMLKEVYGDQCTIFELEKTRISGVRSTIGAFKGYIDGISAATIVSALREIQEKSITKIFVDGSNLGEFSRAAKKKFPKIQIYTFFHNVESRFFLGALKQTKTPQALAVVIVNYMAERKSVHYSDKIICLNERDSQLLKRFYGKPANHILPMVLKDKLPETPGLEESGGREEFALFVGGIFYANRAGIEWFVKNVVPLIQIKICIVGRGFEKFRKELEIEGKVEVFGEVDSLAKWYQDAHFVIAPIFDGSGMKTKVAEALMFGKKIIGTPEAFTGYEEIAHRAGRVCRTADEFVNAIESIDEIVKGPFDPELREIYEKSYSYEAARARIKNIMG